MKRTTFLAVAVLLVAASAVAQSTVRCESSDGRYVECRTGMLDYVTLSRTLNDSSCVEGQTWGFRNNVIWVDRGCRADFLVSQNLSTNSTVTNDTLITCESLNNARHQCHNKVAGGVTLVRQLSDNECVRGRSWGVNQRGIWVDKGCRAQFSVGGYTTSSGNMTNHTVICESAGGRKHCPTDTNYGVRITRQISAHSCALGRDWGYDENGIWVTNGCRAEFTVNGTPARPMASSSSRPVILCESKDGHRGFCAADTTYGVSLSRQLSDKNCVRGQTWGWDSGGIWVTGGCRAEFLLDTFR